MSSACKALSRGCEPQNEIDGKKNLGYLVRAFIPEATSFGALRM